MDSEMVLEVPDTPDREAFARSVCESSLWSCNEDTPSLSNQYSDPTTRTFAYQLKNSSLCDTNGNNSRPVDGDFLFRQARIARVISDAPDSRNIQLSNSSEPSETPFLNDSRSIPAMIDLSQGSSGPRYKAEKHGRRKRERNVSHGYAELPCIRSSINTEDLRKDRNSEGSPLRAFVCFNNLNETENIKGYSRRMSCDKGKVVVQQVDKQARNERLKSGKTQLGVPSSNMQQKKHLYHGCTSPYDLANSSGCNQDEAYCQDLKNPLNQIAFSSSFVRKQDNAMENDSCKESQSSTKHQDLKNLELGTHPRKNGHRRLVRNGCISPSNIARNMNNVKDKGIEEGSRFASKIPKSNSHQSIQTSSSEGKIADKGKGKEVIIDKLFVNSQQNGARSTSSLVPVKEVTVISDAANNTGMMGFNRWGAAHNRAGSSSLPPSSNTDCILNENLSSHVSSPMYAFSVTERPEGTTFQAGANNSQVQGCLELHSEVSQHIGKRKISSTRSNTGECSSSTVDSIGIPHTWRSARPAYSRSTRSRRSVRDDIALAPIVEVDELDSITQEEKSEVSDEYIARAIQLESDEVLARQLQEQFYLELPPVGATENEQVDLTITRPLLQEEDDHHTSIRRWNQSHPSEALLPAFLRTRRLLHSSTRMPTRARTENRIGRMRRNMSRPTMSLEERLDFLEALEEAFDNGNSIEVPGHILQVQRDFNENDYEILLSLDENNHQHVGASERQINSLPQSIIQKAGSEEACAVCLDVPSVGDHIRHLPCLHKFHKNCIDKWLRRKRSCPICKSGIT